MKRMLPMAPAQAVSGQRVLLLGIVLSILAIALYQASLDALRPSGVLVVTVAVSIAVALGHAALRGSPRTLRRMTFELFALGVALAVSETIIEAAFPARAVDYPVSRAIAVERTAREHGIEFDTRLRSEIVDELRAKGLDVLPGVLEGWASDPSVRKSLKPGFYPLANASNSEIIECNEGPGYLRLKTDEYGFNNPGGLIASRNVNVAVVGESLAFGRCVAPSKSAVAIVRNRYPRTVTLGIANARLLSQLAIFREYVEPLQPSVVLWFLADDFVDAGPEADEPRLTRYLNATYSQDLLHRQGEVDEAVRNLFVPWQALQDDELRKNLAQLAGKSLLRTLKLPEVRRLLSLAIPWRARPDLDDLERVLRIAHRSAATWDGKLVAVLLPTYGATLGSGQARLRYEEARHVTRRLGLPLVDGAAAFRAEPDPLDLYLLRIDNHPSERGHAVLAAAILNQLTRQEDQ